MLPAVLVCFCLRFPATAVYFEFQISIGFKWSIVIPTFWRRTCIQLRSILQSLSDYIIKPLWGLKISEETNMSIASNKELFKICNIVSTTCLCSIGRRCSFMHLELCPASRLYVWNPCPAQICCGMSSRQPVCEQIYCKLLHMQMVYRDYQSSPACFEQQLLFMAANPFTLC